MSQWDREYMSQKTSHRRSGGHGWMYSVDLKEDICFDFVVCFLRALPVIEVGKCAERD